MSGEDFWRKMDKVEKVVEESDLVLNSFDDQRFVPLSASTLQKKWATAEDSAAIVDTERVLEALDEKGYHEQASHLLSEYSNYTWLYWPNVNLGSRSHFSIPIAQAIYNFHGWGNYSGRINAHKALQKQEHLHFDFDGIDLGRKNVIIKHAPLVETTPGVYACGLRGQLKHRVGVHSLNAADLIEIFQLLEAGQSFGIIIESYSAFKKSLLSGENPVPVIKGYVSRDWNRLNFFLHDETITLDRGEFSGLHGCEIPEKIKHLANSSKRLPVRFELKDDPRYVEIIDASPEGSLAKIFSVNYSTLMARAQLYSPLSSFLILSPNENYNSELVSTEPWIGEVIKSVGFDRREATPKPFYELQILNAIPKFHYVDINHRM